MLIPGLYGQFWAESAAAAPGRQGDGAIVSISSMGALVGLAPVPAYSMSKARSTPELARSRSTTPEGVRPTRSSIGY